MPRGRPKSAATATTNRVYELRTRAGLTQVQLGELVGCTSGQVQKIESGKRRISEPMLHRLAKALAVRSVADVFQAPGDKNSPKEDPRHEDPHGEIMRLFGLMNPETRETWLQVGRIFVRGAKRQGATPA